MDEMNRFCVKKVKGIMESYYKQRIRDIIDIIGAQQWNHKNGLLELHGLVDFDINPRLGLGQF